MTEGAASSPCPGCGLELAAVDGPTHPYIGASAACWAAFGELLAREYGELDYPDVHGLTVDVYAVQHPGEPGRRATQSVCVHLIGLCLALEHGVQAARGVQVRTRVAERVRDELRWLDPPRPNGVLTVRDALKAQGASAHDASITAWARDVWAAWGPHHETVRGWIGRID